MRALDRHTVETLLVSSELLMEVAGAAVAREAEVLGAPGAAVWVACGAGNNGGDGRVAARHLRAAGSEIGVFMLKPRDDEHVAVVRELGVHLAFWSDSSLREWLNSGAVIVDALLGTGTARPIGGDLASLSDLLFPSTVLAIATT